ncbi:hypothetical protein [Streptomyces sp. NBC_00009]|uniref:hypothetical protein n=1 Tax=Streptomyces sp. NBC_00009 TaxID=2975620 RepID=UPI003254BB7E
MNPYVRAVRARQEAALAAPHQREPQGAFTDSVAGTERHAQERDVDRPEAVRLAAIARKRLGVSAPVRRTFDVA